MRMFFMIPEIIFKLFKWSRLLSNRIKVRKPTSMVFFLHACLKRRSVKSHEGWAITMLMDIQEAVRFWLCFDNQKKSVLLFLPTCVFWWAIQQKMYLAIILCQILCWFMEKTVKSPILCLQGTHSVVGDIKKSVITSYAWVKMQTWGRERKLVFFHLEWPVGSYLPENLGRDTLAVPYYEL